MNCIKILLAKDPEFQSCILSIEMSTPITKNHYERYHALLTGFRPHGRRMVEIFAETLIEAGANADGVHSALSLING